LSAAADRATTPPRGSNRTWSFVGLAALLALILLLVKPDWDVAASALFFRAGEGFPLAHLPAFTVVIKGLPILVIGAAIASGLLGIAATVSHRTWLGITPRLALYIVLSLAIGPGLLVNTLLKDHWGRARPHQILEFGGALHFTPVLEFTNQCARNCSFPSGHGALGFWTVTLAILAPPRWRDWAIILALTVGAMVGLMRIAQGAHFLSDVLAAALLVVGLNFILKYLILGPHLERV